jgi:acyl-CoA thioesterase-1
VALVVVGVPVAAADAPQSGAGVLRLLVLGDSLGSGYGLARPDSFTVRLEAALRARGHGVKVIDGSVSGDTSAGGRSRLAWSLGAGTHGVIVELGGNDGLRGIDPAATKANLSAILKELARRKIPVLLAGMKAPRNFGADYAAAFDAIYPALARSYGPVFYPFFLDGVALDPGLNQNDGIHPNAEGVRRIVDKILPAVERLLQRMKKK